jgi:hypothetical protein
MKLTSQQIDAVVYLHNSLIHEEKSKEEKRVASLQEVKEEAEKYYKSLTDIPQGIRNEMYSIPSRQNLIDAIVKVRMKGYKSRKSITNHEVVITSIDAESMEELKSKLSIIL